MTEEIKKILGEYISKEDKTFGGVDQWTVHYKQPNSTDPTKIWKHKAIIDDLPENAVLKLDSLSAGERFCVHQTKGADGYPCIVDATDAKDAPEKAYSGKAEWKKGGGNFKPRDETGIAVGAAWTNAVEIAKLCNANFDTSEQAIEYISNVVVQVLKSKLAQEAKLRAEKAKEASTTSAAAEKKLTRAEQIKLKREQEEAAAKGASKTETKKELEEDDVPFVDDDLSKVKFE